MKRPIKFRGKRVDNGQFVYGDLIHMTGNRIGIIFDKRIAAVEVDPDSVAQLVGYDKDGREVYEGDIVIEEYLDDYTCEHVARLESMSQNPETAAYYFWTYPSKCKLKGVKP